MIPQTGLLEGGSIRIGGSIQRCRKAIENKAGFIRRGILIFPRRDRETPSANSPPWAHRYKQYRAGSDATQHNSGDTPPPDNMPAAASPAWQSSPEKLWHDQAPHPTPRQFSSAPHSRRKS